MVQKYEERKDNKVQKFDDYNDDSYFIFILYQRNINISIKLLKHQPNDVNHFSLLKIKKLQAAYS